MSTNSLRVGIIGCGGIGRVHARAYRENADLGEVVACADTESSASASLAATSACAAYSDALQMLDQAQLDAVSICTPPASHLPLVREAAHRGIAVLCEKPLTRNLQEAQEMVALVEKSGITFMNALCHRFHGPLNQMRQLLLDGKLGKPVQFYNRFAFRFEGVEERWFTRPEVAGGGILLDTAVHSLDIFRYLAGEVATIHAQVSTTLPIAVEDSAAILLRSTDGVLGEIACSWVTPPGTAVIQLYGTDGTALLDYEAQPNLRYRLAGGEWVAVPYEGPDRFVGETRHFLTCVRDHSVPSITVHDGARAIALLEEAYRSAGRPRN